MVVSSTSFAIDWSEYDDIELKRLVEHLVVKGGYDLIDCDLNEELKIRTIVSEKDEKIAILIEQQPSEDTLDYIKEFALIDSKKHHYIYTKAPSKELLKKIELVCKDRIEIWNQFSLTELLLNFLPEFVGRLQLLQHEILGDIINVVGRVISVIPTSGENTPRVNLDRDTYRDLQVSLWELKDLSSAWYMSFYHLSYLTGDARDSLNENSSINLLVEMNATLDEIQSKIIRRFQWRFNQLLLKNEAFVKSVLLEKVTRSPIYNMLQIPDLLTMILPGSGMVKLSKLTEGELNILRLLNELDGEGYQDGSAISIMDGAVQIMGTYASVGKGLDYLLDSMYEKLNNLSFQETESIAIIDGVKLKELLRLVITAKTTNEKGTSLESLSEYIFSCVEGFTVLSSKRTSTGEIDRIVRNNRYDDPFFLWIGGNFLIEAKNWKDPVSAAAVSVFVSKIRKARCTLGILMTRNGVTGEERKYAEGIIYDAFKDDMTIVVMDESDLNLLLEGKDLIELLKEKTEQVRFS